MHSFNTDASEHSRVRHTLSTVGLESGFNELSYADY